jgi:hypothetical protein
MSKLAKPLLFGALLPLVLSCQAHYYAQAPSSSVSILPLKSLRLYETGVGYFERSGSIESSNTGLPVPAGHLDDALKTLVLLSSDGTARVHGIVFPTSVSKGMGRALAGLPQNDDEAVSYRDLLLSMKGATIEVRTAHGPMSGRLIDVLGSGDGAIVDPVPAASQPGGDKKEDNDAKDKTAAGTANSHELTLLLLSEQGELQRLSTAAIGSIRPLDPHFASRLRTALDAVTQRGAQSQRLLRLLSREGGPVTLGYIAETPLWRVTYRLVLNEVQRTAALQGWSLIHNDTDEDWREVRVHLVSGRPDSFLFPLAAPRYFRRPLVTPENELSTVPQLLGTTADKLWGDHLDEAAGGSSSLGLSGVGMGGGGTGEGTIGLGNIGTVGHGSGISDSQSSLLQVGNLAAVAQTTGVESGALFTYSLNEPLDLKSHSSALLPFISEAIEAEVISWMQDYSSPARSGVRLSNSTHQTLPAGPLAVYSDGGLAGESALPRLKPGERRFIQYGHDLDVELTPVRTQSKDEPQRVTFDHDVLAEHFLRRQDVLYRIVNRSGLPRTLYLGLTVGANARVQGADRLDFDTEEKHAVAVFELPAQSRIERPLSTVEGLEHNIVIKSLHAARLLELSVATTVPPAERAIVQEAAARQKELEEAGKEIDKTQVEIKKIEKELERLREHLKAMGPETAASALQNPVLKRLLDAEDRLTTSQKKLDTLESAQDQRRDLVRKVLEKLPKKSDKT